MKLKCVVTIECPIDVPDSWNEPEWPYEVLNVARYHYNEKLDENEALKEIKQEMAKYIDERNVEFDFDFEEVDYEQS